VATVSLRQDLGDALTPGAVFAADLAVGCLILAAGPATSSAGSSRPSGC
jgi:hypothetical protein